jgi:hypothetical protein
VWSKAAVLKTVEPRGSRGSNPWPTAILGKPSKDGFFMPEALLIISAAPKPSVAQNLLLRRPAPVAHIAVGSHPDENEVGRNVLVHCSRVDFV